MRLFILGATGGIGRALIDQALARGHHVTAFVRSPSKLGPPRDGLSVMEGDPRRVEQLRSALPGHDAVLSSLGPAGIGPTTLVGDCALSTVTAMKATGVSRLLIVGVAVLFEHGGLFPAIARRTFLRNVANDSAEMERVVTASGLDWTIARPPRLTNGPLTRAYGTAVGRMPRDAKHTISRADVAHFLLEELEHPAYVRAIVGLASVKPRHREIDERARPSA